MDKNVYFASCSGYEQEEVVQKIETLFSQLEVENMTGKKILLKPNLLSKSSPEKAITTHPEVVRGVIIACKKRGATDIMIADSAGGLYNPKQSKGLYQGCGIEKIALEEGVRLYTDCQWKDVPCTGEKVSGFKILEPVLEADIFINLPKCKTHSMMGMTAACKNLFGCIPGLDKSQWHTRFPQKEDFGAMLVDLFQLIPPSFSILDGILAMEGDGPGSGTPRSLGLLMASCDSLGLDLALAEMMGFPKIAYLEAAKKRGICAEQFDPSLAQGESALFAPISHWVLPKSYEKGASSDTTFSQFLPKAFRPLGKRIEASLAPRPVVLPSLCVGCKKCAEICSKDAIIFQGNQAKIKKKDCISCFCCHEVCPVKAIEIKTSKFFSH
ncbi:MAG: DUF362 domain-containing protein [Eubacteriales bacterium]